MKTYFLILNLILTLFLSACGTDSGNPSATDDVNHTPVDDLPTLLSNDFIGNALCEKISTCFNTGLTKCDEKILVAKNISQALSINTSEYPNLAYAIRGVLDSKLILESSHVSQCKSAISALSCSDALATSAYSLSDANNLDNAFNLLSSSASCAQMVHP